MVKFRTIIRESMSEQVIDKSRFIGYAKPVETKEAAEDFFNEIRSKNKSATHNVPAYVIGERFELQWASDDGEPQGTSGAPIVQMLVKEGITNVALIITRYFGGIKLGTGGLVRAYTSTAKLALEGGVICDVKELTVLKVRLDYTYHGKLQNRALNDDFRIRNTTFEDVVTVELLMEAVNTNDIKTIISNLTGGSAAIISESKELTKVCK